MYQLLNYLFWDEGNFKLNQKYLRDNKRISTVAEPELIGMIYKIDHTIRSKKPILKSVLLTFV